MNNHTGRLTRLELLPTPPERVVDWSRLTPEEYARYIAIDQRTDAVGLDGLTDAEIQEAAALAEKALGRTEWTA